MFGLSRLTEIRGLVMFIPLLPFLACSAPASVSERAGRLTRSVPPSIPPRI